MVKTLPDEQFELNGKCEQEDCPIDVWFPRFRYLLHTTLDDTIGASEAAQVASRFAHILNEENISNPLIVIRACFLIAAEAWKQFKENVEKGEYKSVVN